MASYSIEINMIMDLLGIEPGTCCCVSFSNKIDTKSCSPWGVFRSEGPPLEKKKDVPQYSRTPTPFLF